MDDNWNSIRKQSEAFRMQPSEAAWKRVQHRLDQKKRGVVRMYAGAWAIAASVVGLVAVVALLLYQNDVFFSTQDGIAYTPEDLELLNPADTDAIARMALDYTRYLQQHHPEMMEGFHEPRGQSF